MQANASAWLDLLIEHAEQHRLPHFDLLLDATGLAEPLAEALPEQPSACLFEHTPEQALASQGPHLRRYLHNDPEQLQRAAELITAVGPNRVLALLSHWPFEPLRDHLQHHTQAYWNNARHSGVLRFYDPRLFPLVNEVLLPAQADCFHAPAISWLWRNNQNQPQQQTGSKRHASELPSPLPALNLSDTQVFELVAWSDAVAYCEDHALTPSDLGHSTEHMLYQHILQGIRAAQRERVAITEREDFLQQWLAQQQAAGQWT